MDVPSKRRIDHVPLSRSERMARIRKIDTKPELVVRQLLHALGFRFRLHRQDLPGNPDIVFPSRKKVILVHGCFWHRHSCPWGKKVPTANPDYWIPKLRRNQDRDAQNLTRLHALGWTTLTLWECELANSDVLAARLIRFLERCQPAASSNRTISD
jgi:DNA mismatch endonuclease (patch repair protein)